MFDNFDREWRFMRNNDSTITRGRAYRLPEDWTGDSWEWYWDGDLMVAFYDEGHRGYRVLTGDENAERAIKAFTESNRNPDALNKVAQRIEGVESAAFVHVSLDQGTDLYALAYDGDPEGEWAREIQAVNWGDIWRIECEDFDPDLGWQPADEYPEQWYGEDKARAEFERVFDMAEFPAEQFVGSAN